MSAIPQPGSVVELRSATWKVLGTSTLKRGYREVHCRGISGLVRDKEARFVWNLESDARVLDPAAVELVLDTSSGLVDTKLHLEAAFRHTPTTTRRPLTLGRAAIDDLTFQHLPVEKALAQDRVRLLIADDVGLGKTLEAGLITSELALRGRADRILVGHYPFHADPISEGVLDEVCNPTLAPRQCCNSSYAEQDPSALQRVRPVRSLDCFNRHTEARCPDQRCNPALLLGPDNY